MLGVTTDPEQVQEYIEDPRKQYYMESRNYFGDDRRSTIFFNDSTNPYVNEIDSTAIGYDFPQQYSPAQYNSTNLQLPSEYYQSDQMVTVNTEQVNKFIEVTKKDDLIERRNYLKKKKRNAVFFKGPKEPNINQIDYLITKDSFQTHSFTQYDDADLFPDKYYDTSQRLTEFPGKKDLIETGYFYDNDEEEFYNDLTDPYTNKIQYLLMKNGVKFEDKSTQYSNINLKLEENKASEDIFSQNYRTRHASRDKNIRLSTMPTYYAELIPKANRSRTSSPLAYINRKENSSFNRLNIIHNGGCKHSKSQNFSFERQMRHETLSDINCVKEKQHDDINNRTYFVNRQEERPFIIGQVPFTQSDVIQNKLEQRNERQIPLAKVYSEIKPEPKSSPKPQLGVNEKQAVKYQCSSTAVLKQTSMCSNSSRNILKEYPAKKKEYEQKGRAYKEAINYTQYLIKKLSEKNSNRNVLKEGQRKSLPILGKSEEKFTQTLRAPANKKAKNLIFKEKVTQTIK